jgi:RNA polymerase sigma factor (sigma-70 family)
MSQPNPSLVNVLLGKQQSDTTDGELLIRFLHSQCEQAFGELVSRHGAMVFAVARRLLGSLTDAEDVSQAVFLLLARKASTLRTERSLAGWLYGVTRRLCADLRKQQKRRERREDLVSRQKPVSHDPEPLLHKQEALVKLDAELAKLALSLREPLVLHCLEGLSHQEIAQRLGVALGTVASRLSRAKELLKNRLVQRGVGPALSVALFSGIAQARVQPTLCFAAAQAVLRHQPLQPLVTPVTYSLYHGALVMSWQKQLQLAAAALLVGGVSLWGATTLLAAPQGIVSSTESLKTVAQDDLQKLQGTWYCVAAVPGGAGGRKMNEEHVQQLKTFKLTFKGEELTVSYGNEGERKAKVKLNPGTSPKRLEFIDGEQPSLPAVYSVDGDVLIFTFQEGKPGFPSSLAATKELQGAMLVLQKIKPHGLDLPVPPPTANKVANPRKSVVHNHLRQLALAFHNYVNDHQKFPENIVGPDGKVLLSWRVELLPYLEQDQLARQFKRDEPWDSEHNKALLKQMPKFFAIDEETKKNHTTAFQRPSGPGTAFEQGKQLFFKDIKDGTSNTLLVVEAEATVPWTKPADLVYDANLPAPKLGKRFGNEFQAAMIDGSSRHIPYTVGESTIKALMTREGGEVFDLEELSNKKSPAAVPLGNPK